MIKSILPTNIVKTGFIGTALLGMACAGAVAQNKPTTAASTPQQTEILSKEASSALKTQVLSNTVRILPDGNIAEYNSAGKIVRECLYDNDSLYRYYTYKYNDDGTLNLNAAYSADGDCIWARAYYYNQDGIMSDLTICDDTISIRYFDKDGYLLMDTITPDYKIVDTKGREVDINLKPIQYEMSNLDSSIVIEELEVYIPPESEQAKIILGEGVVLKNKEKIYDNSINKDLLNYIDK